MPVIEGNPVQDRDKAFFIIDPVQELILILEMIIKGLPVQAAGSRDIPY